MLIISKDLLICLLFIHFMSNIKTKLHFSFDDFISFYSRKYVSSDVFSDAEDLYKRAQQNIDWLFPSALEFDLKWHFITSNPQYTIQGEQHLKPAIEELMSALNTYNETYRIAIAKPAFRTYNSDALVQLFFALKRIEAAYEALPKEGIMGYVHSEGLWDESYKNHILGRVEEIIQLANIMYLPTSRKQFIESVSSRRPGFGLAQLKVDFMPD